MADKSSDELLLSFLPKKIAVIARKLHEERHFPIPYIIASILYATSVAIGNTIRLSFPAFGNVYGNIIMALVGDRGSNKSAPMSEILNPLQEIDHSNCELYNKCLQDYESLLPEEKRMQHKPVAQRVIVSDVTTEKLCILLEENSRGLGLYVDELMSWVGGFDRYRKHSGGVDESFFLSIYNCSPITKDRAGSSSIISIQKPYLSVIGSIQPQTLRRAITRDKIESGFFDRLLLASYEEDGFTPWSADTPLECSWLKQWKDILTRTYNLSLEFSEPDKECYIICQQAALDWIVQWRNDHEEDNALKATKDVQALFKKTQVYGLKMTILTNVLKYVCGEITTLNKVDFATAVCATNITDWFYNNSKNYLMETLKTKYSEAQTDFVNNLPERFSTAEAISIGNRFGMKERTVKLFLKEQQGILFVRVSHGNYYKKDD